MKKPNKHIGSSLEDLLKEEGVLEVTRAVALKETLAWQVQQARENEKILRDVANPDPRAHAVGRNLRIQLV
jgi:hypothetical protein